MPLARIKTLLAADPDHFTLAIAEIDRNLQARAAQLLRTCEQIGHLGAGDRLFISAEVADCRTLLNPAMARHWVSSRRSPPGSSP